MITNLISGLLAPCFALYACAKSRRYWRQCRRLYTFQPIYRTSGALLAVELLTAVYHPNEPDKRQSPEHYFSSLGVAQRLQVIQEQLALLQRWQALFIRHAVMVSVNIDGIALQALQRHSALQRQIAEMPYLRFELVEHAETASNRPLQQIVAASGCGWTISAAGWPTSPPSAPGVINTSRWRANCLPCSNSRKRASSCSAP